MTTSPPIILPSSSLVATNPGLWGRRCPQARCPAKPQLLQLSEQRRTRNVQSRRDRSEGTAVFERHYFQPLCEGSHVYPLLTAVALPPVVQVWILYTGGLLLVVLLPVLAHRFSVAGNVDAINVVFSA